MPKLDSPAIPVLLAAAVAVGVSLAVSHQSGGSRATAEGQVATASAPTASAPATATPTSSPPASRAALWVASAPGRVEPLGGEVRLGPQSAGRIVQVVAKVNDRVQAGDVLVRLDDADLFTRHAAIEAEAGVRKRERDAEQAPRGSAERRTAEDAVATAERAVYMARFDVDMTADALRRGKATADDLAKVRDNLTAWRGRLEQEREGLRRAQSQQGIPLPTRLEAALTGSRADLSLAEAAIERMRIRAPSDGTVLQINAKVGEMAAAGGEQPMVVFGDVSRLQVRAEVEERDVAKLRIGQRAVVRSDAYPGREFEGRVSAQAQSLAAPRLSSRGPRKPSDVDVLEVIIDLDGQPPVLPGMRVDVFFRPDPNLQTSAARVP